jgi:DNA-binding transcriptional ArsR family regulator
VSTQLPDLAAGRPQATLRIAPPTLAATMPTAMLLVDYALNRNTMPIPELVALAEGLPEELVDVSWPVRASMAHGAVLRSVLLHQLPAGHPGHLDWVALRNWMADWSDEFVNGVIDFGCDSVMSYGKPPRHPARTAARIESFEEPTEAVRRDGPDVLRGWAVPRADERASEILDPSGFRRTLINLLDAIWDDWLGRIWTAELPRLRALVSATADPPPGCTPTQWITLTTGLRPDPSYAEAAEHATELIIMPTPGLGRSLSLFSDQQTWVLFSPQDTEPTGRAQGRRTGISINRLGQLSPVMTALGDRTRLAIVLHLIDHGPLAMQRLADALEVHQSTISRQVTVLRKAGIVSVQDDRKLTVDRARIKITAETLLATLE